MDYGNWYILLLLIALVTFALFLTASHYGYVEESRDWCAEAGGVFIYPRTGPDICIDLDAVIPFPEEE